MASHYTRAGSPFYWIKFRRPDGTRGAMSSGVRAGEPGALKKIRRMVAEERVREQSYQADGSGEFFRAWVEGWFRIQYQGTTLTRYVNAWAALAAYLDAEGVLHPAEIGYRHAEGWMRWRTDPPEGAGVRRAKWNTALTDLRVLSAVMQEAVRRGFAQANPLLKTGFRRRDAKIKPAISRGEEEAILSALAVGPRWMLDAFRVAMCHGCRLSEVQVPAERIHLGRGEMTLRGKGGSDFIVPIHPDILGLAEEAVEARRPLVTLGKAPAKKFCQLFASIGLGHLSFHCTRVTVATRLRDAGVGREDAMEYLNHASEVIHQIYLRSNPDRLRPLHAALGRHNPTS